MYEKGVESIYTIFISSNEWFFFASTLISGITSYVVQKHLFKYHFMREGEVGVGVGGFF